MQLFIISFVAGFGICALNSAVIVYTMWKRIRELEKFLFIRTDLPTYTTMQSENNPYEEKINKEWADKKELERAYRHAIMQDTVSDDDIKKFGIKEMI